MDIAIVGGTGKYGFGLALRLSRAGHNVMIGSRSGDKAKASAEEARAMLGAKVQVGGATNEAAAGSADVVFLTVPFAAHKNTCEAIAPNLRSGTVLVDATNPGASVEFAAPADKSVAEEAAELLPPGVRVVAGFQTVSAARMRDLEVPLEGDILVCGDDSEAKETVGRLAEGLPNLRWVDAGPLAMARIVERLTALLVSINKRYGVKGAGVKIVGID
ncbi:MAG: NADPH-dependent F420 reductase [Actinomycetota bacterium]